MLFLLPALLLIQSGYAQLVSSNESQTCFSYGIDFQNEGRYFQNASSTDPFTFVSVFEGCQNDSANNLLVNPRGDELECSMTQLRPDDVNQISTCPVAKNALTDGPWSVVIISNNGNGQPIAYERDFLLSVGVPSTVTYTPTATVFITSTPVVNSTLIQTSLTTLLSTKTSTQAKVTRSPTTTITPARITTTTTKTDGTVSKTAYIVSPTVITSTHTKTCSVPPRQHTADPVCRFVPTLVSAAALSTTTATPTPAPRRRDNVRRVATDRTQRLAERKARLGRLDKRGLDQATTTVTEPNTSKYVTSTSTTLAPAVTMSITSVVTSSVSSVVTSTLWLGTTTLGVVTITAPTPTKTHTKHTVLTVTQTTITKRPTVHITYSTAPALSTLLCRAKGGRLV